MAGGVDALDVLAFAAELALLAGVAVAGVALVGGAPGVGLAVALLVGVAVGWGRWLAPRATHPLPPRGRLAAKTVLALGTGVLLAVVDRPGWALVLCVVAVLLAAAELRSAARGGPSPTR